MPPRFSLTTTDFNIRCECTFKRLIADLPQPSGGALLQTITESNREDRKPGGATGFPGCVTRVDRKNRRKFGQPMIGYVRPEGSLGD
jgi:hypothetical protein